MNELTLATPTFLFSAISLLMLAYTNRFLAYASLVRNLHAKYKTNPDDILIPQIINLKKRLSLTRAMQILGISSLLLCVVTMFLIYVKLQLIAAWFFALALFLLIASLATSIREIWISTLSIDYQLQDLSTLEKRKSNKIS